MQRIDTPVRWRAYLALARAARAPRRIGGVTGGVALTFDDGPDPATTPLVLQALAAAGARATFFCVGYRVRRYPELVREIVRAGHAIGSHSETHRLSGLGPAEVLADYERGRQALEEALGGPVRLFRPPHGHLSTRTVVGLRRGGYRPWLWSVDPGDYVPGTTAVAISDAVGAMSASDVVLLHDALEESAPDAPARDVVVEALPVALDRLRQRGLVTVTLQ